MAGRGSLVRSTGAHGDLLRPSVSRIGAADLRDVLAKGLRDFGTYRTDVMFLCVIYPVVGLVLARLAFGYDMLPLMFLLASGFALLGGRGGGSL
jgi:uncharacterized membrane protein